jgi:hypothetical protein
MSLDIFAKRVTNYTMAELTGDMGKTWRHMVNDSQYRWIGPEKSVTHLAVAGVLNAVWDLWGKIVHKPVWKIVADMSPEEVVRCIDFRYITDALTPEESLEILKKSTFGKEQRIEEALANKAVPVRGRDIQRQTDLTAVLGLLDVAWMASFLRKQDGRSSTEDNGRRLHGLQVQSRQQP